MKYLTVEPHHNHKLTLYSYEQITDGSIFHIYERQTTRNSPPPPSNNHDYDGGLEQSSKNMNQIIGLQNKSTLRWLGGQSSILGWTSVVCKAKAFGFNEEWEVDEGIMERTRILCASVNSGSGGWFNAIIDENHHGSQERGCDVNVSFSFGGYDALSKRNATLWTIVVMDD